MIRHPQYRDRQNGAVLFIALVFLVILSTLGISSMQSTTLEERMAGNLKDENLAQQAAEAALRAGEAWIQAQATKPALSSTVCSSACESKVYYLTKSDGDLLINPYQETTWSGNAVRVFDKDTTTTTVDNLPSVGNAPRFYLEELAELPLPDDSSGVQSGTVSVYRITSRGTGGSDAAQVLLQSTFTTRF